MEPFSKEADKTKSPDTVKPAPPSMFPLAAQGAQTVRYEEVPPPSRTSVPAAQAGNFGTYLDKGSRISGELLFEGAVRIDGEVDGEITANDAVVIGETAVVSAHLKAPSVVITGKMSGDITAAKRIEIRPTAKVFGNLTTPVLLVHDGALFEGHCTMNLEAKEDRKVMPLAPKGESVITQAAAGGNKLT
jgi:cytoskeletal protein CcmA (bactofilin family)